MRRPEASGRFRLLLGILAILLAALVGSRVYLSANRLKPKPAPAASEVSLMVRGIEMAEKGRWLEAVEMLDTAAQAGTDNAQLHRALGRCLGLTLGPARLHCPARSLAPFLGREILRAGLPPDPPLPPEKFAHLLRQLHAA